MLRCRIASTCAAVIALLLARPVLAQTAADRETARLLLDRGDEQFEQGEFGAALTLYRGAHELMHVPTTGIEVARAYEKLGSLVEARGAALEVLRMPKFDDEPAAFAAARAAAERLAQALTGQMPSLRVEILPQPASERASLHIDGALVPIAAVGLTYTLNPTEHVLTLTAPGFRAVEQRFALSRGERKSLRFELVPMPLPNTPSLSSHGHANQPSGSVTVHALSLQNVPAEQSSLKWPAWFGLGLAGTGLIVGTVAGVVSLSRTKSAKAYCQGSNCTANAQSDRDAALASANVSNVGFAIGLVGATICVTSIWLSNSHPRKSRQTAVQLGVLAMPNGAGLHLDGAMW